MNIKTLALTVALAAAAATAANAATNEVKNGQFNKGLTGWSAIGTTIGTYKNSNAAHIGTSDTGTLGQFFTVAVDGIYNFGFKFDAIKKLTFSLVDFSTGLTVLSDKLIAGASGKFTTTLDLDAGHLYALAFTSKNAYVDGVSVKSTVAVPGPEAGAGLGALAMGGAAFWMTRRRRDTFSA